MIIDNITKTSCANHAILAAYMINHLYVNIIITQHNYVCSTMYQICKFLLYTIELLLKFIRLYILC